MDARPPDDECRRRLAAVDPAEEGTGSQWHTRFGCWLLPQMLPWGVQKWQDLTEDEQVPHSHSTDSDGSVALRSGGGAFAGGALAAACAIAIFKVARRPRMRKPASQGVESA
jgi:hypothetical protein